MPEISKDLADKVLAASARNTIKAVGDGKPLSPAERDVLELERGPQLDPEQLLRERHAALLLRWRKGSKLSEAELAEIAAMLPSNKAAARKTTAENKQYGNAHYAKVYDTSDRTIKAWCRKGREATGGIDFPPLDEPANMAKWYARHFPGSKVPAKLYDLAKVKTTTAATAATATSAAPGVEESSAPPPPPPINMESFSFDQAVQFAAENLTHIQNELRKARTTKDETTDQIDLRRVAELEKAVNGAQESYRKAKADEHEHALRNGQLVDRSTVFNLMREKLGQLNRGIRSVPVRAATKLALAPDVTRELVKMMNDELDSLFTGMKEDRWIFKERLHLES